MAKLVRDTKGRILTDSLGRNLSSEPPHKFNIEVVKAVSKRVKKPSYSTLLHLDNMISALKAEGIWQKLDTFVNCAYNTTNTTVFSLYDFIRDVNYTSYGGLDYVVYGFKGNAVDGYLDTNYNPALQGINYTLNNAGRGFTMIQGTSPGENITEAVYGNTARNRTNMNIGGSATQRINTELGPSSTVVDLSGDGLKTINRYNSNNIMLTNKNVETSFIQPSSTVWPENQVVLRTQTLYSSNTLLCYFMGSSLTYEETQLFRQYYNEYLTNIGLEPIA